MERDDYYGILGVSRHASCDAVKRAFRSRVCAVHPDLNPNEPRAAEQTRKLVEAYRVLSDPRSRRDYDLSRTQEAHRVPITAQRAPHIDGPSGGPAAAVVFSTIAFVLLALLVARGILAQQPRVFRPFVGAIDLSATHEDAILIYDRLPDRIAYDLASGDVTRWPIEPAPAQPGEAVVLAHPVEDIQAFARLAEH